MGRSIGVWGGPLLCVCVGRSLVCGEVISVWGGH